jgi:RNA polymerase sigma-70 factor (ECF subfamily)
MHNDDDLVLLRRIVAKDRQAFETLYHRYARRLYGYLAKFIGQQEVIEEVLDDVMFVVWQQAARFDNTSRLSTWIFGIAYHKALKARARAGHAPPAVPPAAPGEGQQEGPEGAMTRQELRATVARALDALSPQHRAVVELAFYQEHSYQEIAVMTGCPVNTVKTRMFHARQRLAHLLAGWGPRRVTGEGRHRHDSTTE